jgi:hypothetical protein
MTIATIDNDVRDVKSHLSIGIKAFSNVNALLSEEEE